MNAHGAFGILRCPSCRHDISLSKRAELGMVIQCSGCGNDIRVTVVHDPTGPKGIILPSPAVE